MSLVSINWSPDRTDLRKTGLALLVGFGVIGGLLTWGLWPVESPEPTVGAWIWILGGAAGLLALTGTKAGLPVYWLWMGIAFVMGNIMSRVVLGIFYFLVITPTGLIMRLIGRDPLGRKRKETTTYWSPLRSSDPKRYQRQF